MGEKLSEEDIDAIMELADDDGDDTIDITVRRSKAKDKAQYQTARYIVIACRQASKQSDGNHDKCPLAIS